MSEYPRDEFDDVPEKADRQGVHRERLAKQRGSGIGLIIVVAALALVIGVVSFLVLPRLGLGVHASKDTPVLNQPTGASNAPSAPGAASSSAAARPENTDTAPGSQSSDAPSPSDGAQGSEAASGDKSTPVSVYNATGTAGLGATVSERLGTQGWSVSSTGDWAGNPVSSSIVYYPTQETQASAAELAQSLGITEVVLDPSFTGTLAVVLGPGFTG